MKCLVLLLLLTICEAKVIRITQDDNTIEIDIEDEDQPEKQISDGLKQEMTDDYNHIMEVLQNPPEGECDLPSCPAKPCDNSNCKLPDCRCSGEEIPNNQTREQTPQAIILSFHHAVHDANINLYLDVFKNRVNPNNCPAVGTFFVQSLWSNNYNVQQLYHNRHEIASNGVQDDPFLPGWMNYTVAGWCQQIQDNRKILSTFSQIKECDIRGFRTPNLYMGDDIQFEAYDKCGVQYDGTRVAQNRKGQPDLTWPYSYKYMSTQDCPIGKCPKNSYPKIWQVPLEALNDTRNLPCADLQGCHANTSDDIFNILYYGFLQRYNENRAPLMVSMDNAFLLSDFKNKGLVRFLDAVQKFKDVFLVTAHQALTYTQHPEKVTPCKPYPAPFNCKAKAPSICDRPRVCWYDKDRKFVPGGAPGGVKKLTTCVSRCPSCYPALGDPYGKHC